MGPDIETTSFIPAFFYSYRVFITSDISVGVTEGFPLYSNEYPVNKISNVT